MSNNNLYFAGRFSPASNGVKKLYYFLITLWLNFFSLNFLPKIYAQTTTPNALDRLRNTAQQSGYATTNVSPQETIASIILYVLGFLGIIFLALTVYSGFQWMTAGGNEERIKEAKHRLQSAVIGLGIVLAAYAITLFVFRVLIHATTQSYYAP